MKLKTTDGEAHDVVKVGPVQAYRIADRMGRASVPLSFGAAVCPSLPARAKGLAVNDVVDAGILVSKSGKTALMKWQDYPEDYDPTKDTHRPVWEVCHLLVRIHQRHGTGAAGEFLSQVQAQGEQARQLAYVLYTICERK